MAEAPQNLVDKFNTIKTQADSLFKQAGVVDANSLVAGNKSELTIPPANSTPLNGIGSSIATVASNDELLKVKEAEAEKIKKEKEVIEKAQPEKPKSWLDWLKGEGQQTPSEARTEGLTELGFEPNQFFADQKAGIAELGKLQEQYNNKEAEMNQKLLEAGNRTAGMTFIRGEQANIRKAYNIELSRMSSNINAKTALMENQRGNFTSAQNYVNQAVNDYTYELEMDFKTYQDFISTNENKIKELDTQYQKILDETYNLKLQDLEQARADKTAVGNLLLNYPNAGILMSDSIDEAMRKAGLVSGRKTEMVGSADTGYSLITYDVNGKVISNTPVKGGDEDGGGGGGFMYEDALQDSINLGSTPEQAVNEVIMIANSQGINLTLKQVNELKARASKLKKIEQPITPEQPKTPSPLFQGTKKSVQTSTLGQLPKAIGGTLKGIGSTIGNTVGGFFSGLFGE